MGHRLAQQHDCIHSLEFGCAYGLSDKVSHRGLHREAVEPLHQRASLDPWPDKVMRMCVLEQLNNVITGPSILLDQVAGKVGQQV